MFWQQDGITVYQGSCLEILPTFDAGSVNCCVTSPPYWGLRDYGHDDQLGLESTPEEYVAKMVSVFREVKRVLRDDGTLWLNLGDSYAANRGYQVPSTLMNGDATNSAQAAAGQGMRAADFGVKPKDLLGIPWRVAFALQADGWYLRQDIIWHKPNPMPESVRDRCTKAHEYIFLLSKSERYYFDADAIAEPLAASSIERLAQQAGSDRVPGKTNGTMKAVGPRFGGSKYGDDTAEEHRTKSGNEWTGSETGRRNKRSVWTVTTKPFKGAHFATFPPDLIEPCILAGCPPAGKRCDCDVVIETPTGTGPITDPSMLTGRSGMNRPRRPDEGTRPITRREQRWHAEQMKQSPNRDEMAAAAGDAFAHYIRTDLSGARPLPESLRVQFMNAGWITDAPPCDHPTEPAGTVLDPFTGSGTTAEVAQKNGCKFVGCELNPDYIELIKSRFSQRSFLLDVEC